MNLYAYAGNNPIAYSDPFGLCPPEDHNDQEWCHSPLYWTLRHIFHVSPKTAAAYASWGEAAALGTGMTGSAVRATGEGLAANARSVTNAAGENIGFSIGSKIEKQMGSRGWTDQSVGETIANPDKTVSTTDTRHLADGTQVNDPATAYYNKDGSYVVRNDKTGDIVQVSNRNDPNWKGPADNK